MELNDSTFFVAQFPDADRIFNTKAEAIDALKDQSGDIDVEESNVSIVEVDFSDDDWAVMELAWQEIAIQILNSQ